MPFTLTIDTGNAAFADDPATELGRIFHHLADALPTFLPVAAAGIPVLDSNGNTVGRWSCEIDSEWCEHCGAYDCPAHEADEAPDSLYRDR